MFFVISGFLITSILIREFENKTFTLKKFYERRARRILPALVVVIIVTSIIVPLISSQPKFLGEYGNSVISTMLFASNIYFWQTSGYFGSASELSPMLHTWSLAVEEQYYLFFPILLMTIFSFGKRTLIAIFIAISIVSIFIAQWGAANSPIGNFYLLPSRAWELFAGAIAATIFYNPTIISCRDKHSAVLAPLGMLLILGSYLFFSPITLHPSLITIVPVMGAVIVILFSSRDNLVGRFLSNKPIVFVGLISYSLYLWHQPVLALMKRYFSIHLELEQILTSIVLIFILSYLSWKYVESPFRDRQKFPPSKIINLSLYSILALTLLGWGLRENLAIQKAFIPEKIMRFEQLLEADNSHSSQIMFDDNNCKFWSKQFDEDFEARFKKCKDKYEKAVVILGGSHGMDLYNAIAMNTLHPFVVSVSKGFCRAHKFIGKHTNIPKCQYEDFMNFSDEFSQSIEYVFYTQTPDRLFKINAMHKATEDDLSIERVEEVVDYLAQIKRNYDFEVIMIGMLPPLKKSPINWSYEIPFNEQYRDIVSLDVLRLTRHVDQEFESRLKVHGITYVSKIDAFSISFPEDLVHKSKLTYSDSRHMSYYGEEVFGGRLVKYLSNMGYRTFKIEP